MTQLVLVSSTPPTVPALIAEAGDLARFRFVEFFFATLANPNTRRAYAKDVAEFLAWCSQHGATSLSQIMSPHVARYIDELGGWVSKPTVKRHLAAIRRLFDHLTQGGVHHDPNRPARRGSALHPRALQRRD